MQSDFTDASVVAFCKAIKLHLPHVANAATTRDGQDARIEQLMASVRTVISLPGAAGARKRWRQISSLHYTKEKTFRT